MQDNKPKTTRFESYPSFDSALSISVKRAQIQTMGKPGSSRRWYLQGTGGRVSGARRSRRGRHMGGLGGGRSGRP